MASETFIIDDFTVTPSHEAFIDELSCNDQMIDCEAFEAIEMIKSFEEKYTIEAIASYDQITKVFNVKWEGSDENTDEHLMEQMDEDRGLPVMITNFLLTKHYREREKELKKLYEETSSIHVEMEKLFEMIKDYIQIPPYNENFIHECPEDRCMTRSV